MAAKPLWTGVLLPTRAACGNFYTGARLGAFLCGRGLRVWFPELPHTRTAELIVKLYIRPGRDRVRLTQDRPPWLEALGMPRVPSNWLIEGQRTAHLHFNYRTEMALDRLAKQFLRTEFYAEVWYREAQDA